MSHTSRLRVVALAIAALAMMGCARSHADTALPPAVELANLSVRERVKLAAQISDELASKAELPDRVLLKRVGMEYSRGPAPIGPDSRAFPRTEHVRRYETVRPWSTKYIASYRDRSPWDVQPWPRSHDAPGLRKMIRDRDPRLRSLAAEALATLHQHQDVPLLARMLNDSSQGAAWLDWGMQGSAQGIPEIDMREDTNKVEILRAWRKSQVGDYASRAIELMTGEKLDSATFAAWWQKNRDARNRIWYWEQRIRHDERAVDMAFGRAVRAELRAGRDPDRLRAGHEAARRKVLLDVFAELRKLSPETEAKVVLLSGRGRYGYSEPFVDSDIVGLRISRARLLDILDRKHLWPDVDWHACYQSLVRRLALLSDKLFKQADVGRLREVMRREFAEDGCPELEIGIARLLPAATGNPDTPGTREGELRSAIRRETSDVARGQFEAELVRAGLPASWEFIRDRFFSETGGTSFPWPRDTILQALGESPLTPEKRRALVDIVTDSRFAPMWIRSPRLWGDDLCRTYAARSLNAHAGFRLIDDKNQTALAKQETSRQALAAVLNKIRTWAKGAGTPPR